MGLLTGRSLNHANMQFNLLVYYGLEFRLSLQLSSQIDKHYLFGAKATGSRADVMYHAKDFQVNIPKGIPG
jgi:hypothetical protein